MVRAKYNNRNPYPPRGPVYAAINERIEARDQDIVLHFPVEALGPGERLSVPFDEAEVMDDKAAPRDEDAFVRCRLDNAGGPP